MPALSRWSIRLALAYLLLGFTLGALLLISKGTGWLSLSWRGFAAHQEFLLIGWTAQMAIGIGYWIFPRFRGNQRGNTALVKIALLCLNVGIWLVALNPWLGSIAWQAGRLLEGTAAIAFGIYAWPRIKSTGA